MTRQWLEQTWLAFLLFAVPAFYLLIKFFQAEKRKVRATWASASAGICLCVGLLYLVSLLNIASGGSVMYMVLWPYPAILLCAVGAALAMRAPDERDVLYLAVGNLLLLGLSAASIVRPL